MRNWPRRPLKSLQFQDPVVLGRQTWSSMKGFYKQWETETLSSLLSLSWGALTMICTAAGRWVPYCLTVPFQPLKAFWSVLAATLWNCNQSHLHLFPTVAPASCCRGWLYAKNITLYIGNTFKIRHPPTPKKLHHPLLNFLILGMWNKNSQASKTPWLYSQQHAFYLFIWLHWS